MEEQLKGISDKHSFLNSPIYYTQLLHHSTRLCHYTLLFYPFAILNWYTWSNSRMTLGVFSSPNIGIYPSNPLRCYLKTDINIFHSIWMGIHICPCPTVWPPIFGRPFILKLFVFWYLILYNKQSQIKLRLMIPIRLYMICRFPGQSMIDSL